MDKMNDKNSKYGFYDRLTAEFPSQIIVDLTEVCNLACIHCPHPDFKKSEHYGRRYLDLELNAKMAEEVQSVGQGLTQYIRYTSNGEPLIHPKGYEMVDYAVRHSGVFVTLTTNGTIMDEKRTQRLLDSGVHMIDISIDAYTSETYSKIRINGDFETTCTNVNRLLKWVREAGSKTKVVVSYVEQPENQHETSDFKAYWENQGADFVVIRRLHSAAGAAQDIANTLRLESQSIKRFPCVYPWERITLNPMGFLAFCPADWVHGSLIPDADYRHSTIQDVWKGEYLQALREAHLENEFSKHPFCGQCPDWQQTRWPGQGRSYASLVQDMSGDK
jgi:MoaA/NifB/PqqE/SkfB family radical SAM enzyme